MHLIYKNFNLEDWENIILTIPFMFKEYEFIYSLDANDNTNNLPAIIEIYENI